MKKLLIMSIGFISAIHAQKNIIEIDGNFSKIQLSTELGYKHFYKHTALNFHIGYGNYGKESFSNKTNSAYNQFTLSPYLAPTLLRFSNSNVGVKFGVGFGYFRNLGTKHRLQVDLNVDLYKVSDTYNQVSLASNGVDEIKYSRKFNSNGNYSFALSIVDTWKLNHYFGLKYGIVLPYLVPFTNAYTSAYTPKIKYLLMYGIEPYLTVGIQFSLSKKDQTQTQEKSNETPK